MKAREAVRAFLDRVADLDDPAIFISVAPPELLDRWAREIDARDDASSPLRGLVFGVKDNIDVAGIATTAGCPTFAYEPSSSATVVSLLLAAGAIPVAKTNMDQFATGLVGTRSPYGTPRNPFDPDHVPGGSSSGSAVAVARGLVDFALGTDTAGSGRVPAAFCGIVGLKPTFGIVSTTGTVPAVQSADCVSIMARDIELAYRVLTTASRFDAADPFSREAQAPRGPTRPGDVRLGCIAASDLASLGADAVTIDAYADAVRAASAIVGAVIEVELTPFLEAGDLLYGGPWVAERTAAVGDFIDEHPDDVDPIVKSIISAGRAYDAVAAHRGRYRLAQLRRLCETRWESMDVLALPTVPRGARLDEVAAAPTEVNTMLGRFTTFANLLDLSAVAMPIGSRVDDGMPMGMTLFGRAFEDPTLAMLTAALTPTSGGREPSSAAPWSAEPDLESITLVVAGAHLRGQPLAHQLTDLGARFVSTTQTAPTYRLFALAGATPAKPGLVHDPEGRVIEVDTWELTPAALGRFLQLIPAPLALGKVTLGDGREEVGFVCEPRAAVGATDISNLGGWRAYQRQLVEAKAP